MTLEPGDIVAVSNIAPYAGYTEGAARIMQSIDGLGTGALSCAINPAASLIAVGHGAGTYLRVFNAADLSDVTISGGQPPGDVNGVAFSPDGSMLAIAHASTPFVTIYNTTTWAKLTSPAVLPTGTAYSVAWSPDGTKLAVGHATAPRLTVYNVSDWSKMADPAAPPGSTAQAVAFSPNGATIMTGLAAAPWIRAYSSTDLSTASAPSLGSVGGVKSVAYSPDGSRLAVGTESSNRLFVFDPAMAAISAPMIAGAVNALDWASNYELVIGSSGWPRLTIHNFATGSTITRSMIGGNCLGVAARKYAGVTISGAVRDNSANGISRVVRAYRRDTGEMVGEAVSNGVTGAYSIKTRHSGEHDVVMLDDAAGSIENDQILRTTPV